MIILTGKTLLQKYGAAVSDRNMQREAHRGFSASLPPQLVGEWGVLCATWDSDGFPKSAVNPFHVDDKSKPPVLTHLQAEQLTQQILYRYFGR